MGGEQRRAPGPPVGPVVVVVGEAGQAQELVGRVASRRRARAPGAAARRRSTWRSSRGQLAKPYSRATTSWAAARDSAARVGPGPRRRDGAGDPARARRVTGADGALQVLGLLAQLLQVGVGRAGRRSARRPPFGRLRSASSGRKEGRCQPFAHAQVGSALPADRSAPCAPPATYSGRPRLSLGRLAVLRLRDAEDAVERRGRWR